MNQMRTIPISFQQLNSKGEIGIVLIKLMIACNDLQFVNEALSEWQKDQPPYRKYRQSGALMYFLRLEMAHLYEALKIIDQNREMFTQLVEQCDPKTQASFNELTHYLQHGSKYQWLEEMIGQLRSNLVFHYNKNDKMIRNAIKDRASRKESRISLITRGSSCFLWHFKPVDDIIDSIIVRKIWKITKNIELRTEVDKIIEEVHNIFILFLDFSGEVIWKFFSSC